MIYIALGANLPSDYGTPAETLKAAVAELEQRGIAIVRKSSIWCTAPVPYDPNVPDYHNAVIGVETTLSAQNLLQLMLDIEEGFGRVRTYKNAPRLLDLDLIAYHEEIIGQDNHLIVPHPRMHERLFVLKPLEEIAEKWSHPLLNQNIKSLLAEITDEQTATRMEGVSL